MARSRAVLPYAHVVAWPGLIQNANSAIRTACLVVLSGALWYQTGSGKTFTITGGPEKYEDRGIIPRVLSHIFNEFKRRSDWSYQVRPLLAVAYGTSRLLPTSRHG
eukprot:3790689-Rhodomonas_salina.1